jgi:spermidine/putrescine ABC transporter ATP-binding subunit
MNSRPIPKTGAAVELTNIVKRYGGANAVSDVSLRIEPGEFVSLLGPSGSGKTTTLMMLAGFIQPDSGRILLGGADITTVPPHRRGIGMVYQSYALFPHMTVARNVAFPLRMRRYSRADIDERVARALALVRMDGFASRLPGELSGGQQQRIALARALVFEPPLLLMDEPLGALDKKLREEMQVEIKRIQIESGSTAVYVTHDQEEALNMSDRIVVMDKGRIEQAGTPRIIHDQPRSRFVADFMGVANLLDSKVTFVNGKTARVRTEGGCEFGVQPSDGLKVGDQRTVALRAERISIRGTPSGDPNETTGRLLSSSYRGSQQCHAIVLDSGESLSVLAPSGRGEPVEPGQTVFLNWHPADTWVI